MVAKAAAGGKARRLLGYDPAWTLAEGLRESWSILSHAETPSLPLPRPTAGAV